MRPIPDTITDPRSDRLLYKTRPSKKIVKLTDEEAEALLRLATFAADLASPNDTEAEALRKLRATVESA